MKPWLLSAIVLLIAFSVSAGEDRWWPIQTLPKAVVETGNQNEFPEPQVAFQMMVQSIAGLAAKAVNEGRGDGKWSGSTMAMLISNDWYAPRFLGTHPKVEKRGTLGLVGVGEPVCE